jgi:hypothetical protein
METNMNMSRQLVEVMTKQVHALEDEVERLKDALRECSQCNVVLFCSNRDLSVAAVTNGTPEGVELFARVQESFCKNEHQLHKRGIAFGIIENVPINHVHDTPFGR